MPEISPSKYVVQAGWQDVPHLSEQAKTELLNATPPWLRDARTKGEPTMGAGAVYPLAISEIEVEPFKIGNFWKRGYALDVGWNRTAALWGAQNPDDGVIYIYSEYYKGRELPIVHAAGIKSRGEWMRGAIDPGSKGSAQRDGVQMLTDYRSNGLNLVLANNDVENGLEDVWQRLSVGRIKIFSTLQNFKIEYRVYRRDEHGKIIKKDDHLMDCLRYLIRTWDKVASLPPKNPTATVWKAADRTGL